MAESMEKAGANHEIDILASIVKVFAEWKLLCKIVAVFGILGVVVALSKAKTYTTTVLLAPETSDVSSLGNLSSVGSMLGLNFGGNLTSDAIFPEIYPEVIVSTDFVVGLFDVPVTQLDSTRSKPYYRHLISDVKIPFWSYPMKWIGDLIESFKAEKENAKPLGGKIDPFRLTKKEMKIVEAIQGSIIADVDKKTSIVSISVTDTDPQVSALLADTIMTRLQDYIIAYRTKKARNDLEYFEKLYRQLSVEYMDAQKRYTQAEDSYRDVILSTVRAKVEDLGKEVELRYAVLSETAKQLQVAKGRVQEQTPAFTVIQHATVPLQASSTPRTFVVIAFAFLGGMIDVVWVLFLRDYWCRRRKAK